MEGKLVYHVDRRGVLSEYENGEIIKVCSVENPYYSSLLVGNQISVHGNSYLNLWGIGYQPKAMDSIWELFAELVRLKNYPDYGSRYHAMFGFENQDDLKQFISIQPDTKKYDWKVYALIVSDFLQRDMMQFKFDPLTENVKAGDPNTYLDNLIIKHCCDYWDGNNTSNPVIETLIYGEATVHDVFKAKELFS